MLRRSFLLAALALLAAGCATGPSGPPKEVIVNVFPGGFNWPIWVAAEKGFFAANGVKPSIVITRSSRDQLTGLITGKFDIAMTAIDNLVAYREGQGAAPMIGHDLIAVLGGDQGGLHLVVQPEIKNFNDLRGKTLSVDALTTGYAFVLFELLDRNGLKQGPDYKLDAAGGVLERFNGMVEKKHAGTLLITPWEAQAEGRGLARLATARDSLGAYQGLVAGVRRAWADRNEATLVGYVRAYVQGVEWLYDPTNRAEALAIFQKSLANSTPQQAETAYRLLLNPAGLQRRGQIDMAGVKTVLDLRSKWSTEKRKLTDVNKYYDPKYHAEAVRGMR